MAYAEIKALFCYNVLSAINNGQSASKPRIEEGSTTIGWNTVREKSLEVEHTYVYIVNMVNDMVCALAKVKENLL